MWRLTDARREAERFKASMCSFREGIDRVIDRGERLEMIERSSQELMSSAKAFERSARGLRRRRCPSLVSCCAWLLALFTCCCTRRRGGSHRVTAPKATLPLPITVPVPVPPSSAAIDESVRVKAPGPPGTVAVSVAAPKAPVAVSVAAPAPGGGGVAAIARLQRACGAWPASDPVLQWLGVERDAAMAQSPWATGARAGNGARTHTHTPLPPSPALPVCVCASCV